MNLSSILPCIITAALIGVFLINAPKPKSMKELEERNSQLEETYKQQEALVQLHRSEARKAVEELEKQEHNNKELAKANQECQDKLAKQDYIRGVIDTMALICPALVDKVGLQVKEMAKKK